MPLLLLRFPLRNLPWFWWVYLCPFFVFFSLTVFYILSVHCVYCFKNNMLWGGSILAKPVWCPGGFLYVNGQNIPEVWEIFCYYFIECITYLFSCTSSPSSMPMILSFGLLMELLSSCILLS
jgi:hypothetical protein